MLKNRTIMDDEHARIRSKIQRDGDRGQFPLSPCVLLCTLDEHNCCLGCKRTLVEITGWSLMSSKEQWAVIDSVVARDAED